MISDFKGKTALLTGAASGFGLECARIGARLGMNLVLVDVQQDALDQAATEMQATGAQVLAMRVDVSDAAQMEHLARCVQARFGAPHFVFNNAGVGGPLCKITDVSWQDYQQVMDVNLGGVFLCMQHQIRQMLVQGGGKIVNVSSVAGLRGLPNSSVYSASKHAVVGLTKSVAVEYVRKNIRINAVCPVFTRSAMVDSLFLIDPSYEEKLKRNIPMGRYGQPEDISQAILWLCADENSFLTGHALPMDGGMMA